jgi:hypothetical protein
VLFLTEISIITSSYGDAYLVREEAEVSGKFQSILDSTSVFYQS